MQLVLNAIIYFTVVRRLPCSLIIYLLWPHRANVCVSLRRTVTKDKCDAAAVPAPFRTFKKNWHKCEKRQNKTKKKPDSWNQSAVRAAAPLRPRRINNGGMSRGSHLGIHLLRRFGCLLQASREASVFVANARGLASRYGGSPRYSKKARTVRSSHWSNGKKCTGHRFSHYSTRLQTKARRGGWKKKKSRWCFSSLKTTPSFCSGWQFKGVLGSSDSAD